MNLELPWLILHVYGLNISPHRATRWVIENPNPALLCCCPEGFQVHSAWVSRDIGDSEQQTVGNVTGTGAGMAALQPCHMQGPGGGTFLGQVAQVSGRGLPVGYMLQGLGPD